MASATVVAFPTGRRVDTSSPFGGNLYAWKAAELVIDLAGKRAVALRINAAGDVTLVDPEFHPDAITSPGFACLCSEGSDPSRIAGRLRAAHLNILAGMVI